MGADGSRALQTIKETIEDSGSDDYDEEDILTKSKSLRLGMPKTMEQTTEDLPLWLPEIGNLDSKADERIESPSIIHNRFSSLDEKERTDRTESIKSIISLHSTCRSISLIITPKRKSIQISEAFLMEKRRISLRLSEKLILIQSDPKDHYDFDKKVLGKGTFGKVRRAVSKETKEEVAIKKIRKK